MRSPVRPYLLTSPRAHRSSRRHPRRTRLDHLSFWSASSLLRPFELRTWQEHEYPIKTYATRFISMALTREQQIAALEKDWAENPRWKGVTRNYSAAEDRKSVV